MSFEKSALRREGHGRIALTRFVEFEMPQLVSEPVACDPEACEPVVVELEGGGRILLKDSSHVTLVAQLLEQIASLRKGAHPC